MKICILKAFFFFFFKVLGTLGLKRKILQIFLTKAEKLLRNSMLVGRKSGLSHRLELILFALRLPHEWEPSAWNLVKAAIVISRVGGREKGCVAQTEAMGGGSPVYPVYRLQHRRSEKVEHGSRSHWLRPLSRPYPAVPPRGSQKPQLRLGGPQTAPVCGSSAAGTAGPQGGPSVASARKRSRKVLCRRNWTPPASDDKPGTESLGVLNDK